jgi:5-methylcytosine-specific restriction enzyme A
MTTGRAKKICGHASGCTKLVPSGTRYCPEHTKQRNWAGASGRPRSRNIPDSTKAAVLQRDGFLCQLAYEGCQGFGTTVDHTIPVSEGGSDDPSNLQAICAACDSKKSSREGHRAKGNNVAEPNPAGPLRPPKATSSPQPSEPFTPRTIHLM